jgi:hypothetical protein
VWLNSLRDQGLDVRVTDAAGTLTVRRGDVVASWHLRHLRRTPRPSEIRPTDREQVLWVPKLSGSLRDRLAELDISWVTDTGDVHVRAPWGLVVVDAHGGSSSVPPATDPVRLSRGALATLQHLLERPAPASQRRIASAVGISQPRVSQVLTELRRDHLAVRVTGGWQVTEPERAFRVWLSAAAARTALTVGWFSLGPPQQQIAEIWDQAREEHADVRLCGDWAADVLAPWRRPRLIVVHTDRTLDLESRSFVPASSETGTVTLHVGPIREDWRADPDVVAAMTGEAVTRTTAPTSEVIREILAVGGSDADQAADELTAAWLRARAAVRSGRY